MKRTLTALLLLGCATNGLAEDAPPGGIVGLHQPAG